MLPAGRTEDGSPADKGRAAKRARGPPAPALAAPTSQEARELPAARCATAGAVEAPAAVGSGLTIAAEAAESQQRAASQAQRRQEPPPPQQATQQAAAPALPPQQATRQPPPGPPKPARPRMACGAASALLPPQRAPRPRTSGGAAAAAAAAAGAASLVPPAAVRSASASPVRASGGGSASAAVGGGGGITGPAARPNRVRFAPDVSDAPQQPSLTNQQQAPGRLGQLAKLQQVLLRQGMQLGPGGQLVAVTPAEKTPAQTVTEVCVRVCVHVRACVDC